VNAKNSLKSYRAEFHIHTVLSPCAELEMIPPLIVETALAKRIGLIAVTDHNCSSNVEAVINAAVGTGLIVLPGMEVQTREEVHSLCLFDTLDQIHALQRLIDRKLPDLQNQPEHFGTQLVVDQSGEFLKYENRLLLTSIELSLNELFDLTNDLGGLFIPAHVDRDVFGLIKNLGFIPQDIEIQILEISKNLKLSDAYLRYPQIKDYPLIQSGDAHRLDEILGFNRLSLESRTIAGIKQAINQNLVEIVDSFIF
jgi:PHP family Zn ribbon phosphoesterase